MAMNNDLLDKVKANVTIPDYFRKIIFPSMSSYYADYGSDFDYRNRVLCPFHDEDTPSFFYRDSNNDFKCFGCGAYGDVVTLHQKFTEKMTGQKVSFGNALTFLKKYFIDNEDVGSLTGDTKTEGQVAQGTVADTGKIVAETRNTEKYTYMNAMYARAVRRITECEVLTAEQKKELLWEIRCLREYCYQTVNEHVDEVAMQLREYYKRDYEHEE